MIHRFIVLLGIPLCASLSYAGDFTIDASHSNIEFTIRHLVSKVKGQFKSFNGEISFDSKNPEASKISANIDVASLNTNQKNRDEHLLSDDFFAVKKNPTLSFVSTEIKSDGDSKYKMSGNLTLRGVTKPVIFGVEYLGEAKGPSGDQRIGFVATTKIHRKDFNINWNKTLDTGGVIIGDDVQIDINIEAAEKNFKAKK